MNSIKSFSKNINDDLKKSYKENLKDPDFKNLVDKIHINNDIGILNASKLEDSCLELKNCKNCNGLYECCNRVLGHYLYPKVYQKNVELVYVPCKKKIANDKKLASRSTAGKELEQASFKNLDLTDNKRTEVIKWLKKFYDEYDGVKFLKGAYLYGSFGSGKTYLICALLNELKKKKKVDVCVVYFQNVLRELKDDWNLYVEKTDYYCNVPILLIDDIGAEQVSEWGRDEVLGTILQNRMNNHLTTFFTSNYSLKELERELATIGFRTDPVKSRRIIERIKFLSDDLKIITESKRK